MKMKWYNWVGLTMIVLNSLGINSWIFEKQGYKMTPFEVSIIAGVSLILFVINRP